jgi:hypothetical protein
MCSGGLEPSFRVLFSAIFHGVPLLGAAILLLTGLLLARQLSINVAQNLEKVTLIALTGELLAA